MELPAHVPGLIPRIRWRAAAAGATAGMCAVLSASCDSSSSSPDAADPTSPPSATPSALPTVRPPPRTIRTDVRRVPLTTFQVDLDSLTQGSPTLVPWTEFAGNPETGRELALHVGKRATAIRSDGYLREVAVWSTGVAWYEDYGLRFIDWAGDVDKVKGVPASYDRLAFGPDSVYFVRRHAMWSWSPATSAGARVPGGRPGRIEPPDHPNILGWPAGRRRPRHPGHPPGRRQEELAAVLAGTRRRPAPVLMVALPRTFAGAHQPRQPDLVCL